MNCGKSQERERERGVGTVWWLWETVGVWESPKREQRKVKGKWRDGWQSEIATITQNREENFGTILKEWEARAYFYKRMSTFLIFHGRRVKWKPSSFWHESKVRVLTSRSIVGIEVRNTDIMGGGPTFTNVFKS